MRWTPGRRSPDLEDRRATTGGRRIALPLGGGGLGLGGILILLVLSFIFKTDLLSLFGGGGPAVQVGLPGEKFEPTPEEEKLVDFVSFVLDDAQGTWERIFQQSGQEYPHARLVVYRDSTETACGYGDAATGPFYCPSDSTVYIDLTFYRELKDRFGAPGDFAQAYVLAHEIGHHVQNLLGTSSQVRNAQESDPSGANEMSVRLELQADCYAGVWGHTTERRDILEEGEVEEALTAAAAIGDDRLQREAGRRISPDSFTHGSSEQRMQWFRRGFDGGDPAACDTFRAR
ncbi:MAG TPA: neutral zinc metallopeptidase [Candidatus Polarisedimenticolaceae bacterium]|nr:neutral zinc metallopeptidase [Candidatus Polarisedimenticolaceae bacterium]